MTNPRACACPRDNARDCIRFRSRLDLRARLAFCPLELTFHEDDECQCGCHDSLTNEEQDGLAAAGPAETKDG